jgi:hypothetical protein
MRRLLLLTLTLCCAAAIAPAASQAYVTGFSEQQANMFTNTYFKALKIKYARLIVSWDVAKASNGETLATAQWLAAARSNKVRPLIAFNYRQGCFNPVTSSIPRTARCKPPSSAAFRSAFKAFRKQYPWVKEYSPWNEANHYSQPVAGNPKLAASYYNVVRSACKGCRIVALDVLDQHTVRRSKYCKKGCFSAVDYYQRWKHYAKGHPSIFGLHNYTGTNRFRSSTTNAFVRATPGQVWLTETGGLVRLGNSFNYSLSRAAKALKYMFKLAKSNRQIKRLYIYQWNGAPRGARFDAGVVGPDGRPRPGYTVIKKALHR